MSIKKLIENKFNLDDFTKLLNDNFDDVEILDTRLKDIINESDRVDVAKYRYFADGFLVDDNEIGILLLEASSPNIENKRVGFANVINKLSKPKIQDIVLVVIYHPNSDVWRLTFVSYEYKDAKQITNTAYTQLSTINKKSNIRDIKEAFSVEKVTKEFFNDYKSLYFQICDYLSLQIALFKERDNIKFFSKKLLGRIVFLYFLQKKGWLGTINQWGDGDKKFLSNQFSKYTRNDFYTQILQEIFFNALNKKRKDDYFKIIDCKMPFLNGGLFAKDEFDRLDIIIENDIFKKIFEVFDRYNFTIIEDNPNDSEVAIDPEMLGRVFEDLLENRKDKGAFYTPREIVHYMCQQSIENYLQSKPKEITKLDYIKQIKILDPAIGSGAFPMGILHEIVKLREELGDKTPLGKLKKEVIENSIYSIDIEESAVEIAKLRFWLSIVVDEETPTPLPNLFYKIMVGNSLLETINDFDPFERIEKKSLFDDNKKSKETWDILKIGLVKSANKYPLISSETYKNFERDLENFNNDMNEFILSIIKNTNIILGENFKEKLSIKLHYKKATYNNFVEESTTKRDHLVKNPQIILKAKFNDKDIDKPHTFLNEAKLTAIALSIRFSILKTRLIDEDILKILVLDDLLISLDMSHRLEVINIILNDEDLKEYQKIILTHDRGFFNLLNQKISYLDWKIFEFYNQNEKQCIKISQNELDKARELFQNNDFEASANYLRKETENILKNFLDPNLKYINREFETLNNLLNRVKNKLGEEYINKFNKLFKFKGFDEALLSNIDSDFENNDNLEPKEKGKLRGFKKKLLKFTKEYHKIQTTHIKIFEELKIIQDRVLNPLSHKNEAPIFKKEVEDAIKLISRLKEFLKDKKSKKMIETPRVNYTSNNDTEETISENLDGFVVDFTKDVLDKLVDIETTEELNNFLKNLDLSNISTTQLSSIFTELRFAQKLELFNLDTDATLIRLFMKKEWCLEDKKVWCNFIEYLDENNIIKDRLVVKKLEEEKCLEVYYDEDGNQAGVSCHFLEKFIAPKQPQYYPQNPSPKMPEVDMSDDEIPF